MSQAWRARTALILGALGCIQMAGVLTGSVPLRGLGLAWGFAPAPKVFSEMEGLEGFACSFQLEWEENGQLKTLPLGPEIYDRMAGPYQRRNVYGAALSFGPKLPVEMWRPVYCHGLGPNGVLRSEFGLPPDVPLRVRIREGTAGRSGEWILEGPCDR